MYKKSLASKIFDVCNYAFITLIGLTMLLPFVFVLNGSIVEDTEFFRTGGMILFPQSFDLSNYKFLLTEGSIIPSFLLSIAVTAATVVFSLALTLMLAYAMTKTDMPGHGALMVFLIIMMYFDGGMIPNLLLYRDMGLFDTFAVYVLPAGISVYNALLLRNFLNTIPSSLTESARLDGASEMTILTRILLPLAKPGIATISLFVAVGKWNDWFSGVAYITPGNTVPLQTYLKNMMGLSQLKLNAMAELQTMVTPPPETLKMAAIVLTVLPIVIVYPFVQKYFVQGLLIGSVKE